MSGNTFNSIQDAETYYRNSGVHEWEWFEGFDENEFISFIYECSSDSNYDETEFDEYENNEIVNRHWFNEVIKKFLISKGKNISEYGLR